MMKESISHDRRNDPSPYEGDETIPSDLIRDELNRIVKSRHFRTSRRGKEFLLYVVNQKIEGNGDLLKERLIGTQIFGRKPDYATGEDPVVRVQAGDVRRRLERYHADDDQRSSVVIQIPLGSYAPVFQWRRDGQSSGEETDEPVTTGDGISDETEALQIDSEEATADAIELHADTAPAPEFDHQPTTASNAGRRGHIWRVAAVVFVCAAILAFSIVFYLQRSPEWILKSFWLPASNASKPVLLCLPKPMLYRPSDKLFDRYRKLHPEAMATREERQDQILPLDPTETLQWGDLIPSRSSGPGIGGVIAAINVSRLLTEQDIRFELRFGEEATYAEMLDSPVVLVGGINTYWATQLTSELNFVFDETPSAPDIHETVGAKRVWKMETRNGATTRDYGLITRQLSGKAGQFLVQVAGISHFGTEAASDLLVNKKEFAKALRSDSVNLHKKNLQVVVSTDITNGRAGPPHVVAISSW